MCLVVLALHAHPRYNLIVAANRDEFYDRRTATAEFWSDAPSVLAGRDLQAGGTWLGISRAGRFAAVTNYRQGQREPAASRSRGLLVSDFLSGDGGGKEYMNQVDREGSLYNGFNLIAGDSAGLFYYSNREDRVRGLAPGVYGLSNHLLDTPWPKVSTSKTAFGAVLNGDGTSLTEDLFALLANPEPASDEQLPFTGISPEWERLLSSAFITSADYGTRSSTVVLIGRDGRIDFAERSFGPEGVMEGEVRFDLEGKTIRR